MEKIDMHSRNEYLKVIMESYFKARTSKEKTQLLDEYPDIIGVISDTREGTSFEDTQGCIRTYSSKVPTTKAIQMVAAKVWWISLSTQ